MLIAASRAAKQQCGSDNRQWAQPGRWTASWFAYPYGQGATRAAQVRAYHASTRTPMCSAPVSALAQPRAAVWWDGVSRGGVLFIATALVMLTMACLPALALGVMDLAKRAPPAIVFGSTISCPARFDALDKEASIYGQWRCLRSIDGIRHDIRSWRASTT